MTAMFKKTIFLFSFLFLAFPLVLLSQNRTVTGNVTDTHGEPLIGVNVVERGTSNGTVTDYDGNFSVQVPENATLVFSYILGRGPVLLGKRGERPDVLRGNQLTGAF